MNGFFHPWQRPDDRIGLAAAASGISPIDGKYLAAGGITYQLGDSGLMNADRGSAGVFGMRLHMHI